jgi:HEPN domain-containing protein
MTAERMQHVQQTFLTLGDEFLIQYFLCAHKGFRGNQILSRLFSMGHSLELYAKAALVSHDGVPPTGHDVPTLIAQYDPALILTPDEVAAGEALFSSDVSNVDLGLWLKHEEAMELYQAQYFLKDLKYYLTKDGKIIFPARKSLRPINGRYLELVKKLRLSIKYRDSEDDRILVDLVGRLGFEVNPALQLVGAA